MSEIIISAVKMRLAYEYDALKQKTQTPLMPVKDIQDYMLLEGSGNLETFGERVFAITYFKRESAEAEAQLRELINPDDAIRTRHMGDAAHLQLHLRWHSLQRRVELCQGAIQTLRAHILFDEYLYPKK